MIQVTPFNKQYLPEAAQLFIDGFKRLRAAVPEVPGRFEDPRLVIGFLEELLEHGSGLFAFDQDEVVGYLGWYIVEDFRRTGRRAAYCPEWSHATLDGMQMHVYQTLYRAAAEQWVKEGCQTHALTMLAQNPQTEKVWFWNGFGMLVVDAVRGMQTISVSLPAGFTIRKANKADAPRLAALDVLHCRHYQASPIFMAPPKADNVDEFRTYLGKRGNSVWLAVKEKQMVGFIRFGKESSGAADVLNPETGIAISGAYVLPEYRGQKLAVNILAAAIQDYASQGYQRCTVDFEAFNPEAAAFWMEYFKPVCYSVMRVPEMVGNCG